MTKLSAVHTNRRVYAHMTNHMHAGKVEGKSMQHIEAETKGPTFCRQHFEMHFLQCSVWINIEISLKTHLSIKQHWLRWLGAEQVTAHIGTSNGQINWRMYVSLGLDELTVQPMAASLLIIQHFITINSLPFHNSRVNSKFNNEQIEEVDLNVVVGHIVSRLTFGNRLSFMCLSKLEI